MTIEERPNRCLPYDLELFVIETLRRWKDPEQNWTGEVTLIFPGSGGQISHLREERRTEFEVSSGYGWERVDFGFKKITYQHGRGHMLIESRVVKPSVPLPVEKTSQPIGSSPIPACWPWVGGEGQSGTR